MARPRKKQAEHFDIPEEYLAENENIPQGFQEAFNHAKSMNNPDKAAILYAENHAEEWIPGATKED